MREAPRWICEKLILCCWNATNSFLPARDLTLWLDQAMKFCMWRTGITFSGVDLFSPPCVCLQSRVSMSKANDRSMPPIPMTAPSQTTSTASTSNLAMSNEAGSDDPPPPYSIFDRSIAERLYPARVPGRAQSRSASYEIAFDMDPDSTLIIHNGSSAPQTALVRSSEPLSGLALRQPNNPRVIRKSDCDLFQETDSIGETLFKLLGIVVVLSIGSAIEGWLDGK